MQGVLLAHLLSSLFYPSKILFSDTKEISDSQTVPAGEVARTRQLFLNGTLVLFWNITRF